MKKILILLSLFLIANLGISQKKPINHTSYDSWNSIYRTQISSKGKFIGYEINPHRGDGNLFLYNTSNATEKTFERGNKAFISQDEKLLVFHIQPGFDTIRQLKLDKVKKEKWVKDSLGIYWIEKDSVLKFANLVELKTARDGNSIAYTIKQDSLKIKEEISSSKKKKKSKKKEIKKEEIKSDGNALFIINSDGIQLDAIRNVQKFGLNKRGSSVYYITHQKKKDTNYYQLFIYDIENGDTKSFEKQFREIITPIFSSEGNKLAFMVSSDTVKETRKFEVYSWDLKQENPQLIVDSLSTFLPEKLTPSKHFNLFYSLDERKLFFGLHDSPIKEPKDTLTDDEKAKLDVWHYQDKRLQPQQLKNLEKDKKKSWLSVYYLQEEQFTLLESDTLTVSLLDKGNTEIALAVSNENYKGTYNWNYPWVKDIYSIDLRTGVSSLLKKEIAYSQGISPKGNNFVYFDAAKKQYYGINLSSKEEFCITCSVSSVSWQEDINGMIYEAEPVGSLGYLNEENILIYSEFDIWKYNFLTKELTNLTASISPDEERRLRIVDLKSDSTFRSFDHLYVQEINLENMDEAIYEYRKEQASFNLLYRAPQKMYGFQKAKKADAVIYRKMDVQQYPEIYFSTQNLQLSQQISETNPQQKEYNWPTVELIEWTSYKGENLKGLIYKPEDFDSTKSYPLLVYFYEKYSERKNQHYIPRPSASTINPTEYASAGYVVFYPDIHYQPGHPGKSAYDCIMSGTDKVLKMYPNIDSTRMGLQGQSWGGYQTAQLITLTDRYAAAMAGAPVSNMFSAYGGIRWASGLNRAFQYEHTQSRIGATIWEKPELYTENSPLFGVPNIKTPLLMMHNDNDGAVPWYQGIELFTAMKRLDKPVWLLQYNGEEHNLMKNENRMDLSIRMRQFFDHYLLNQPAPSWLINGIPALQKGKENGFELLDK